MAPRTFKFSFPLPRRKSSSDKQPGPSPQRAHSNDIDHLPLSGPSAKAEAVLGTSTPNSPGFGDKPRMNALRKYPSFMSVTISDAGSDSARGEDEIRSGNSTPGDGAHERPLLGRNQPSSPLLGQSFSTAVADRTSGSELSSPRAHHSSSSTALKSYYDSAKSPLAVSQQTSASSVRDMALRKGLPTVSSPLAQDASHPISPVDWDFESPQVSMESTTRRPSHIDLSSILPRPRTMDPPINSPHLISKSPPRMSLISRSHKSTSGRPKWFGWERKKSKAAEVHDSQRLPSIPPTADELPSYKLNVVRPNQQAENGYHGIESDSPQGDAVPGAEYGIALSPPPSQDHRLSLKAGYDEMLRERRNRSRTSSFGNYSQRSIHSHHSTALRSEPDARQSIRSGPERGESFATMDLLNQSVLSLSSSEDESEESAPSVTKFRRHRIRESIDCADKGEETQVLNALRVTSLKPKPVVNSWSRHRSRSSGSEKVPPVPSIPTRPKLNPRVSSMKWQEHQNIRSALDTYADSGTFEADNPAAGSRMSSQPKVNARGSKMMAVTPDEEKLLEGMRRKRASIRQDVFVESFGKGALHPRDSITRPKTAGAESRKRFFDIETSKSPPNVPDDLARSLSIPHVASAEDLTHDVEFAFPDVPDFPARQYRRNSPPKQSPGLSFTASDLVPSTPTSRRSPITPPPGMGYLDAKSGSYAVSPSRPMYVASKNKHERKRTVSSSVVVLDGAEQRAQQLDEEDAITGWAMNRW